MKPETAFKDFQVHVNADPDQLTEARRRRDAFSAAFESEDDVIEAFAVGSLRRKTQRAPLNDVDIIVVFDDEQYPAWPSFGESANNAISVAAYRVSALLGKDGSAVDQLDPEGNGHSYVRLTRRRRHSVKCFIDDPDDDSGFTIDVVPAIRHETQGLWIPERNLDDARSGNWIRTDPECLIDLVSERLSDWDLWVPTMRLLKYWSEEVGAGMSSLYMEVLAVADRTLPTDATRTEAIQRFFTSAEVRLSGDLSDPAGLCGPIQPDLDTSIARNRVTEAASQSWRALQAERREEYDEAVCLWREVFGDSFPEPTSGCDDRAAAAATTATAATLVGARRVKDSPQGWA